MNLKDFLLAPKIMTVTLSQMYHVTGYVSFSETVLGIIPGSFGNLISLLLPTHLSSILKTFLECETANNGAFVCGLVPGSTAYGSGRIFLGDHILEVNGSIVFLDSFESFLRDLYQAGTDSIQITTQSLKIDKLSSYFGKTNPVDQVIQFGDNTRWNGLCNSLSLFPFAVFCCSTEDSVTKICYSHPLSDIRLLNVLEGVIPCLLLLSDDYSRNSAINKMQIKLEKEHISVAVNNSFAFGCIVLALPSRVADIDTCLRALTIILRVVSFYFGSFERAFQSDHATACEETNRLISVILFEILCSESLFEELQMSTDMTWSHFQTKFVDLPHLPLPETVKVSVDSLITDFEASNFADPFLIPPRRRFIIMGCCLFYKGFLIASHLNTTDLIDIGLFLRHRFILSALAFSPQMASTLCGSLLGTPSAPEVAGCPRAEQSVIWCEVFPTHRNKNFVSDDEPCWPTFGYSEPAGARYVLLVVPKKQTFIAVLLETNGLSAVANEQLCPDSVVIREASKLLNRLDGIGLLSFCEQSLASSLGIRLVSADTAYPSASLFMRTGSRRSRSGGIVLQTLAVTNAKRFSTALKGLLRQGSISKSVTSEQVQYCNSESMLGVDQDYDQEGVLKKSANAGLSKFTDWFMRKKFKQKDKDSSMAGSFSDIQGTVGPLDTDGADGIDAFHYINSRGPRRERSVSAGHGDMGMGLGSRDRAGVPGSYAGSGTLSSSEGPGRDEGIPLPLQNTLPTLFDMSEAHLHSGESSSKANAANRGGMSTKTTQDIIYSSLGNAFSFIFFDRNQGIYVCPNDTYTPSGASMFHRRVFDTFTSSTIDGLYWFDETDDLEEVVFLFPTDPVEWFDSAPALIDETITQTVNNKNNASCSPSKCTTKSGPRTVSEQQDPNWLFDLNPLSMPSKSYWCSLQKFPHFQENEDGATVQSSARLFALCGDALATETSQDLGLQFAFDLSL